MWFCDGTKGLFLFIVKNVSFIYLLFTYVFSEAEIAHFCWYIATNIMVYHWPGFISALERCLRGEVSPETRIIM